MQARSSNLINTIQTLLDGGGNIIVAIDGRCGSGKTTLAGSLAADFECNVFHMDDFFLRPEQRNPARLAEAGGNVDYERFAQEVLKPLSQGQAVEYRRYDCHSEVIEDAVCVPFRQLSIVEGTYSMHPELIDYYDLKVFLDVSTDLQRERIEKRNSPELAQRFFNEWIPMEEKYFDELEIRQKADMIYED